MTDYWQIISLINEILTIYLCDTFKIDFIKEELKKDRDDCSADVIKTRIGNDDSDFPFFSICIYRDEINISVDDLVYDHNVDFKHSWRILFKFDNENISSITIKCLSPLNNKDFLGFKEAFNSDARKRISQIEKIVWGYKLNEDYVVESKAQIVPKKEKDEGCYLQHTELHIDIHQETKTDDIKSIFINSEDIEAAVNVDPCAGGILDPMTPHTDANQSNNDPLSEKTEKRLRGWERMLEDIKSDEAIMKKIDIRNIDSLWNGLVELFSQEHYSDCIKSETSIEYTLYFERYFMSYKNRDFSKERITFDLDKEEHFIRCRGYIDNSDEPTWFLTFIYTEENGLVGIYATSLRKLEMLKLVHFSHVRDLIIRLADAGFLDKSVV